MVAGDRQGEKERFVALSVECADALHVHWTDCGEAFDLDQAAGALLPPLAWLLERLPVTMTDFSELDRLQLTQTSPHSLRHTCGAQAVATGMNLDVVQQLLGHAMLQTTFVYVTAEQRRQRMEAGKFHATLAEKASSFSVPRMA
ncbi:tyrosine-type recombinase/integrase [Burkholderia gladioli]|uniref:tyrosine-type recombinase/integrase n=1 Tax=Burkholderia gladioli TaxID=28095 RepID=UPI003F79FF21